VFQDKESGQKAKPYGVNGAGKRPLAGDSIGDYPITKEE
jgi:hypothetical protein